MDIAARVQEMLASFRQAGLEYLDHLSSTAAGSDEAIVRLKIVEPLLAALEYDLQADLDPEHRLKEGAIDILVRANGVPAMLWELKRTQETDLARHEGQLTRYALAKGVTHAILCNGREVRVYHRVGEVLRFAYAFPLTAFAPGALVPPTEDEILALSSFFDAFRKEAFLEAERMKEEIAATTVHPLILGPDHPQNEAVLVEDLKREIRCLHRFVLLRFRSHQTLYRDFMEEKEQREGRVAQAREKLWGAAEDFEERSRVQADREALEAYLADFTERWTAVEEHRFVEEFIGRSGLAKHLKGANSVTFRLRAQEFYRAYTGLARWHARQQVELRPIRALVEDFTHWQDEISLMAEDYEAEFCLQTVYIFVTRLLLIRICGDKGLITQKISAGGYKDYLDFGRRFFTNIADAHATLLEIAYKDTGYIYGHFFSRDIFDWYTWEEEAIVRLFWVLNRFDFAQVSADLIGHIYEQYVDELERKRKGQFYTPPQVVNYILDQVGYEGPGIVGKRVLDPACGSGRFLVEASRRLIPELKKQAGLSPKELVNERLQDYMMAFVRRGSRRRFYPDDLKKWPIPPADAETQAELAHLVDEIMDAKADVQRWREAGHRISEEGVVLNPRPFLDIWAIPYSDLIDASGFITRQIGGYPTRKLKIQGQRLTFRQQPLSYFESDHLEVLAYLKLYIETNYDDLRARPVADLPRLIHIPKSPQAVRGFLRRLEEGRMRVMLRWMLAVQREALIDEMAFDLYDVDDAQRDKLSGKLYTFDNVLASVAFLSILDNEQDNPMRRLAFPRDGVWHYRATEPLPHAVLLWRCPEFIEGMCDGRTVTTEWRAV